MTEDENDQWRAECASVARDQKAIQSQYQRMEGGQDQEHKEEKMIYDQSGIIPTDVRVLLLPDKVEEKTAGGIILPGYSKDKLQHAQIKATLVAVGGSAFIDWAGIKPEVGDRVAVGKYSGSYLPGADGKEYQVVNDLDVIAIYTNEQESK